MTQLDELPAIPAGQVAPGTHSLERKRIALQQQTWPQCDPLLMQALIWLSRAFNAAANGQAEALRPFGLSPSAFNVLMALHNTPGHTLEPCQLAERLLVSRPSITGLLDTLQTKLLIERMPHPDDRRRVIVSLTPAGQSALEGAFEDHYREQQALFEDLTTRELSTLVVLLRRVKGAVPAHLHD
ncbi:MAG: MarR family winged helix-turn-helix transcriptional regulator [Egibacteraceae bacterium]